jgi:hypothetical protein
MVAVGSSPGRVNKGRSKQFTIVIACLGVMALVLVGARAPRAASIGNSTKDSFTRSNQVAGVGDYDKTEGELPKRRIRQISLLGERNSGTRWTWS